MRAKRMKGGTNIAKILMKPKKDKHPPSRINEVYGANQVHQADLLCLPHDADNKNRPRGSRLWWSTSPPARLMPSRSSRHGAKKRTG